MDGINKFRYIELDTLDQVNALFSKTKRKEQWGIDLIEEHSGPGYLVRLYNDNIKPIPYDISGHNLELIPESFSGDARFKIMEPREEETLFLEDQYKEITNYIDNFVSEKSYYLEKGLTYKTGLLMYGKPGNGKTAFLRWLIKNKLPEDAIKIWCGFGLPSPEMIRRLQKTPQMKVLVFEEITTCAQSPSFLRNFLDFMDGEMSLDNCITIATTNHPEQLPSNIVERPSRFDKIEEFGSPSKESRKMLFNKFLGEDPSDDLLTKSKGMTIAQIKEICLLVKVHKVDVFEAIDKMNKHSEFVKNAFAKPKQMGIAAMDFDYD